MLLNIVSGVVYAIVLPFVALATVYVYFDMRVRDELPGGDLGRHVARRDQGFELTDTA